MDPWPWRFTTGPTIRQPGVELLHLCQQAGDVHRPNGSGRQQEVPPGPSKERPRLPGTARLKMVACGRHLNQALKQLPRPARGDPPGGLPLLVGLVETVGAKQRLTADEQTAQLGSHKSTPRVERSTQVMPQVTAETPRLMAAISRNREPKGRS